MPSPTDTAAPRPDVANNKTDLVYPCGPPPAAGTTQEIANGVMWMRMPLPFKLNHINLWAIRDPDHAGDGWALVDTGIRTPETASAWRELFAGPLSGTVKRVFVTHMHPDHIGMAGWLTRKFECRMWISQLEYLTCRVLAADTGREAPEDAVQFYQRAGWPEEAIETYRTRFGSFGKVIYTLPDSYRRLQDGETLNIGGHAWHVVIGSGHSPEHACLYCPDLKLFISGDQVLPRITSNVSVFPTEPNANPLAQWLASIDKLKREIPDDVLVLPAHNEPFRGLHARLDTLREGHLESLEKLRATLARPHRAVDVFSTLFHRDVGANPMLMSLATGESLAHINYLLARGEVQARLGDDGCIWYRATA
ncbi:MAG: MBL fold metallo-hydrolase [Sinobacteraceae bacterium]|nr:MBL fold metallo-hydrolase [Nevskiaceae bacterium]